MLAAAFRYLCAAGAALNITALMAANLAGFVLGLDGLKGGRCNAAVMLGGACSAAQCSAAGTQVASHPCLVPVQCCFQGC